jgi:GntR family transcriptional regulator
MNSMADSYIALDQSSPVPFYHQLRLQLEAMIRRGDYQPDQALPTEEELAQLFQVSRITVRQAVAELLEDGLLYRKRPRGRLQVVAARVQQHLTRLRGFFTEDMLAAGVNPRTAVLSVQTVSGEQVAAPLRLAKDAAVFRIERLFEGNGEPMALQTSYIPKAVCPDLERKDLSQSLFRYIEETYQKPIVRAIQRLRVREATRHETEHLGLGSFPCIIHVDRTSYAADGTAVEYFVCVLRSDRYDFLVELNIDT